MHPDPLNASNAIWDDGEWISWGEINRHLETSDPEQESNYEDVDAVQPTTVIEKLAKLELLIDEARELIDQGHRDEIDFGELGEFYAEIRYGIKRHRPCAEGSDGRRGNDFIEVKTITPWKGKPHVTVRRSGHFNKLVIVKIDENLMFDARILPRSALGKSNGGKAARVSWNSLPKLNE
ncbi:MAG: hypothetical protein K0R17_1849 [Rariglobus sp.]|jgi:hypothetical protein|nr:hypothetical protein [Rariglobus sp.]